MASKHPIFIVGCPRSGTTLLQSLLATSPELYSQPETNVLYRIAEDFNYRCYGRAIGRRNIPHMLWLGARNRLGITRGFTWRDYLQYLPAEFAAEVERRGMGHEHSIGRIYRQFDSVMNTLADGGRWVEKTPHNLMVLDYIERFFKQPRFIHIVRQPLDNIASIMDAARQHAHFKDRFSGEKALPRTVAYYNSAIDITRSRQTRSDHLVIHYERLTDEVPRHLRLIETFLALEPESLQAVYDTSRIAKDEEVWKKKPKEIVRAKSKAEAVFSTEQVRYIEAHASVPWAVLSSAALP